MKREFEEFFRTVIEMSPTISNGDYAKLLNNHKKMIKGIIA